MVRPRRVAGDERRIHLVPRATAKEGTEEWASTLFCYDLEIVQINLPEAERRIEEARRLQAEWLDLGDLALSELPAGLGDLAHLRILSLGELKVTEAGEFEWEYGRESSKLKDLTRLQALHGLHSLELSDTGVTDLSPLAGLQGLQRLRLRSTDVADLSPLAGLRGLQSLDLSYTGVTDLSPLAGLQGLQSLELSDTGVTDLSPLAGLQGLQSLDLIGTNVTDLSPLSGLLGLQSLALINTDVTDLSPLAGLQGLQYLNLGRTNVTDLSPLSGLHGLRSLYLWEIGVADLSPLSGLQGLQRLNLAGAGVTDLSPLSGLQALQELDALHCKASFPRALLRAIAELPRLIYLRADEASGVPWEVTSHHRHDNCLPRLRTYFSEVDLGAEAENEVKVILLGNGRVGKTQLCRRLRGEAFDEKVESTHGVKIWRQLLRVRSGDEERNFQVSWWDFGGQDIYHGTHALFLRSRAVFLVLWTPSLENREESEENGIPLRNQPLGYWLEYVRTLAGRDSPVIVVQSQCDGFADRRPDPPRPDGFEFFECCACSAKEDEDLGGGVLRSQLSNALRFLRERDGTLAIGRGRAELRRRLYAWRDEDQGREGAARRHRTLSVADFRALCEEVGGIVSWEHALDYLHQTGVVFYRADLFSSCIVLDQDWALDAVYTVFDRGRAAPWLRDSGRFTREDLAVMVWREHSIEEQKLFLGLMESCGVCFRCGETPRGERRYVAPDLLPGFDAVVDRLHAWKEEPGGPALRLRYRFFHPAVVRRLMSEVGHRAGDFAEYWKYGLWLKDGRRDSQLLVRFEDASSSESPGAGVLVVKAAGRGALGLLGEIRRAILGQQMGEAPEEELTMEGATVSRSALAGEIGGRVLDVERKVVAAAAFAAFFEEREVQAAESRWRGEAAAIEIWPAGLAPGDKAREVFISYAWGDETAGGRRREKAVEALQAALAAEGFAMVRDRDQIRSGERISGFIRRLTRADLVVAVISDKYLRSPYCMYEIYRLWQRSQGDADELARRVVPVVLPEVKIGSFEERVPYLEFWERRAAKLERLIRRPKLRPSRESWEEVRLVREFAHQVDGILGFLQDIVMSRDLEVQFDEEFLAVRAALRRRVVG
jgi:internalin A